MHVVEAIYRAMNPGNNTKSPDSKGHHQGNPHMNIMLVARETTQQTIP